MIYSLRALCGNTASDIVELLLTRLPLRDAVAIACSTRNLAIQSVPVIHRIFGCAACQKPLFDPRLLYSAVLLTLLRHAWLTPQAVETSTSKHQCRMHVQHSRQCAGLQRCRHGRLMPLRLFCRFAKIGSKCHGLQVGMPLQGGFFCSSVSVGASPDKENYQVSSVTLIIDTIINHLICMHAS